MDNEIDDEALSEALRCIDAIVGARYIDLGIQEASKDGSHYLRITGICRACRYTAHAEIRIAPGFGSRIVADFVKKTKMHDETHAIILPTRMN